MSVVTIERALMNDAEQLTAIKKITFNNEAELWLSNQENVIDYNIRPPGYASINMTHYMMRHLHYFKILVDRTIVGGIIVTISGKSYGRIDRIFVEPQFQGRGFGSRALQLLEEEFSHVRKWDLETSSRQLNNHYFYEKMGYRTTFESDDEYCYVKEIDGSVEQNVVENQTFSHVQYENCDLSKTECNQVNLEGTTISNSNLMKSHVSNCNLSHSKFQNINFRNTLYGDLNLSNSEFIFTTLSGVRFVDTNLGDEQQPLSFERCDLSGSQIDSCNLMNVHIQNSELKGMTINNIPVEELLEAYAKLNTKK